MSGGGGRIEITLPLSQAIQNDEMGRSVREQVTLHFEQLRMPVYIYVMSFGFSPAEAEEYVQDVFVRLYAYLLTGNRLENVRGWVFRVAHNLAVNGKKTGFHQASALSFSVDDSHKERAAVSLDPEQQLMETERTMRLKEGIRKLTEPERQCLHLRMEGLVYREIAKSMNLSISSVVDVLNRAIRKLRGSLE